MKCAVCQINEPVGVASSRLGAISMAFCKTCLINCAETESVLLHTVWVCGGVDNVAPWVKENIQTFKEGKYLTWAVWWENYGSKIDLDDVFGLDEVEIYVGKESDQ